MQLGEFAVVIPLLFHAAVRTLNEANAALNETPGEQALPAEVARQRIVESVELLRGFGFPLDFERFGSFGLHAEGKFKGLNAGFQMRVVPALLLVEAVDRAEHIELIALLLSGQPFVGEIGDGLGLDIFDIHEGVADRSALVGAGKKATTPVLPTAVPKGRFDRDEARKISLLGSQALHDPRTHAGSRERERSGVKLQHSRAVVHTVTDHRADNAQVINHATDVREQATDRDAALTVALERKRRLHQAADVAVGELE